MGRGIFPPEVPALRGSRIVAASRPRRCTTIFGEIEYSRPWWVNGEERGLSFIDARLGVRKNGHMSRALRRRVAYLGAIASGSFVAASKALSEMTGLSLDPSEIQRETEACGLDAAAEQAVCDQAYLRPEQPGESVAEEEHDIVVAAVDGAFVQSQEKKRGPKPKAQRRGMVGTETAVPLPSPVCEVPAAQREIVGTENAAAPSDSPPGPAGAPPKGRPGKAIPPRRQPGKRRRPPNGASSVFSCEVKSAIVFGAEDRAQTHDGRRVLVDARVATTHEPVEVFRKRFKALLCRCGMRRAKVIVLLGDGAAWIWATALLFVGTVVQILDFHHAREYLVELAKVLFGEGTDKARQWVDDMASRLLRGEVRPVIRDLARLAKKARGAKLDKLKTTIKYFYNNRTRMNYPLYKKMGLPIGSGSIESLGKTLVKNRLCGSGKRWEMDGLRAILALRELEKNNDWESFWEGDVQRLLNAA